MGRGRLLRPHRMTARSAQRPLYTIGHSTRTSAGSTTTLFGSAAAFCWNSAASWTQSLAVSIMPWPLRMPAVRKTTCSRPASNVAGPSSEYSAAGFEASESQESCGSARFEPCRPAHGSRLGPVPAEIYKSLARCPATRQPPCTAMTSGDDAPTTPALTDELDLHTFQPRECADLVDESCARPTKPASRPCGSSTARAQARCGASSTACSKVTRSCARTVSPTARAEAGARPSSSSCHAERRSAVSDCDANNISSWQRLPPT